MSTELQNLLDAFAFIHEHQKSLALGPLYPWSVLERAKRHINDQIATYFKAEEAAA